MKIMLSLHHCQFMVKCVQLISHMMKIFENLVETSSVKPDFTTEVLDGAVAVQAVVPKGSTNFRQYCRKEFTAYLFSSVK